MKKETINSATRSFDSRTQQTDSVGNSKQQLVNSNNKLRNRLCKSVTLNGFNKQQTIQRIETQTLLQQITTRPSNTNKLNSAAIRTQNRLTLRYKTEQGARTISQLKR